MTRALLDVNVLLSLLDADHVEHARAWSWFEGEISAGWASCAITQNGFVRAISQPRYPSPIPPGQAIDLLAQATNGSDHAFWSCDLSVLDPTVINAAGVHGARQVTDAYLLALAVANQGRFVTFDRRLAMTTVRGAQPEHLVVL